MNKIFFLIATGLMVSSLAMGNVTTPDDEAKFQVLQTGSVVRVLYKAATNNDVKIFIYDAKNGKVFSEILNNTSGFVRPYNLANLPIGN